MLPSTLVFFREFEQQKTYPSISRVQDRIPLDVDRFTDEDVDPVDLGGLISWTPPATLRRVQLYRVDLAISGTGALQSDERLQIGGVGPGGKWADEGVDSWRI